MSIFGTKKKKSTSAKRSTTKRKTAAKRTTGRKPAAKKTSTRKSAGQLKNAARLKQIHARAKKLHKPGGDYAQAVKKATAELKREGKLI